MSSARARNWFVKILAEVRDRYGFALAGYVVMPNHIHLLIGEPAQGTPSLVLQGPETAHLAATPPQAPQKVLLSTTCPSVPAREGLLPQFWQPRFYDFNVWSQAKFVEKLHYMHMNPIKRKLVAHPKNWPWSSFAFYTNKTIGLVRIDSVH